MENNLSNDVFIKWFQNSEAVKISYKQGCSCNSLANSLVVFFENYFQQFLKLYKV